MYPRPFLDGLETTYTQNSYLSKRTSRRPGNTQHIKENNATTNKNTYQRTPTWLPSQLSICEFINVVATTQPQPINNILHSPPDCPTTLNAPPSLPPFLSYPSQEPTQHLLSSTTAKAQLWSRWKCCGNTLNGQLHQPTSSINVTHINLTHTPTTNTHQELPLVSSMK